LNRNCFGIRTFAGGLPLPVYRTRNNPPWAGFLPGKAPDRPPDRFHGPEFFAAAGAENPQADPGGDFFRGSARKFRSRRYAGGILFLLLAALVLFSCGGKASGVKLPDGYYAAEMEGFDSYGWKEFVLIQVNNGYIVTVEYNARNISGFIKSWDQDYMRTMNARSGTYPNKYTRIYATALLTMQDPLHIEAISGATDSYHSFIRLADAAINQARGGSKQVAIVSLPAKKP
jgi:major membrane immunogen (membrane-anchored lipoprotein)